MDAPRNLETEGNVRLHIIDGHGMAEPAAAFVKGKNPYFSKVGLEVSRLESATKFYTRVEKPEEVRREQNIGAIMRLRVYR